MRLEKLKDARDLKVGDIFLLPQSSNIHQCAEVDNSGTSYLGMLEMQCDVISTIYAPAGTLEVKTRVRVLASWWDIHKFIP